MLVYLKNAWEAPNYFLYEPEANGRYPTEIPDYLCFDPHTGERKLPSTAVLAKDVEAAMGTSVDLRKQPEDQKMTLAEHHRQQVLGSVTTQGIPSQVFAQVEAIRKAQLTKPGVIAAQAEAEGGVPARRRA